MAQQNGFSLVQLIMVLAMIAILTSVAAPNFYRFYAQHKATAGINDLLSQLRYARAQALGNGRHVSICAIGANNQCGSDWSKGLLLFYDDNADGKMASSADLIRAFPRNDKKASLTLNAGLKANYINYTPKGTSTRKYSQGNLVYCTRVGQTEFGRSIIYSASGRAYLGQDENNNGIVENGNEQDIEC